MNSKDKDISEGINFFFEPKTVAIVGASRNPEKLGNILLRNLTEGGFPGKVFPINPNETEIEGLKAFPNISSVPDPVDLVVVIIPAIYIPDVMKDAAAKGVKSVLIESGGFAEIGEKELQEEIVKIGKEAGIRILGPNTLGVANAYNNLVTAFSTIKNITKGNVSFVAQTGLFSGPILSLILSKEYFGVSKICGLGNKCDVNEIEIIEYFLDDDNSDVIALYLEGISEGRSFLSLAKKAFEKKKPIIVLKAGRTKAGEKASLSHTASLAVNNDIFDATVKQARMIQAYDYDELMDYAKIFSFYADRSNLMNFNKDKGIALLTITGGGAVISADVSASLGFNVVEFSEKTKEKLNEIFTPRVAMKIGNPLDIWPSATLYGLDKCYSIALESLLSDENVDCCFITLLTTEITKHLDLDMIINSAKKYPSKPIAVWILGDFDLTEKFRKKLEQNKIPCFSSITSSLKSLKVYMEYYTRKMYT